MINEFRKVIFRLTVLLTAVTLFSCSDEEVATRSYPVIDTKPVTDVNSTGATFNGEILNTGSSGISDYGFVYDDKPDPSLDRSEIISLGKKNQKGSFTALANRNLIKGTRYYVKAYAVAGNNDFIVYGQMFDFVSMGSSAPEVSSFSPDNGVIGDTVVITGTGFSNVIVNNLVCFGQIQAEVFASDDKHISCIVPKDTRTGDNNIKIKVGENMTETKKTFTLKSCSINDFLPVMVSFGDTIVIGGTNFPLKKELVKLSLFELESEILSVASDKIRSKIPVNANIKESPVKLDIGVQSVSTQNKMQLHPPQILKLSHNKITNGVELQIEGKYFSPVMTHNIVMFDTSKLKVIELSNTVLKVRFPKHISTGIHPVSLTVAGQNTFSLENFNISVPNINYITPSSGSWRDIVTLTGTNFANFIEGNIVKFSSEPAEVVNSTENTIQVKVPDGLLASLSNISINCWSLDNLTAGQSPSFSLESPTITDFTPKEGKVGTAVAISGSNFSPIAVNNMVKLGNITSEVLSCNSNQLIISITGSFEDQTVPVTINIGDMNISAVEDFHLISPWKRVADIPGRERHSAVAFASGGYGYVGSGNDMYFWKYDPQNDIWSQVQKYPVQDPILLYDMSAVVIDNQAFVGLGRSYMEGPQPLWKKFNATTSSWEDVQNPPFVRSGTLAETVNGKAYFISGNTNIELYSCDAQVWEFDPADNNWTRKSDFPGGERIKPQGFSSNSRIILTGGYNTMVYRDTWEYDPVSDLWTKMADFTGPSRTGTSSFSIDNKGYFIGGSSGGAVNMVTFRDLWEFDKNLNSWKQLSDFPGLPRYNAVVFVISDKAYYGTGIGGINNTSECCGSNDFWEFDPSKL